MWSINESAFYLGSQQPLRQKGLLQESRQMHIKCSLTISLLGNSAKQHAHHGSDFKAWRFGNQQKSHLEIVGLMSIRTYTFSAVDWTQVSHMREQFTTLILQTSQGFWVDQLYTWKRGTVDVHTNVNCAVSYPTPAVQLSWDVQSEGWAYQEILVTAGKWATKPCPDISNAYCD